MNIEEAHQVIMRTHAASIKLNRRASGLYMESGPGIGKSAVAFQTCADMAVHLQRPVGLHIFMMATISSVDVRGFMIPSKGGADGAIGTVFSTPPWFPTPENTYVFMPDGRVLKPGTWRNSGQPMPDVGVLFLDEFAQAEDDVKKPAAELVYQGGVGNVYLPTHWRVLAAGNRTSDRSGVMRELMFLVNRRCRLKIDANVSVWLDWASRQAPEDRPHFMTISFAQKNPEIVFCDSVPAGTDPFCTPRTLCLMDRDLRALQSDEDAARDQLPLTPLAREVAAGWIGDGAAAQFFAHLKYAEELPDMADILKDPLKAKLPPKRDAQMVVGYMLAHNVTEQNAVPVIRYIERLNIEMQVLAMRAISAQKRGQEAVMDTREFVKWFAANKELLIAARS
jgi:hypothetical protein